MNGKIKHYQREALKTRLASADPFEVTQMLMEGALESMKIAKINISEITEIAFCDRVYFSIIEMYLKPLLDNDKSKAKYIFRDIEKIKSFNDGFLK